MPSVAQAMKSIDLPDVVFLVDETIDHVRRLENLAVEEPSRRNACSCSLISGDEVIKDGRTKLVNRVSGDAKLAFTSLVEAADFMRVRRRKAELGIRERRIRYHNNTQWQRVRFLQEHLALAFSVLSDEGDLPEDVTDGSKLKVSHLREIAGSMSMFDCVVNAVLDAEFGDVRDASDDDE